MGEARMGEAGKRGVGILLGVLGILTFLGGCGDPTPGGAAGAPIGTAEGPPVDETGMTGRVETPSLNPALAAPFDLIRQGRNGAARIRLRRHLDQHPDDGQARFLWGLTHHREKHYDRARTAFEASIALDPPYPPAHYFLGWAAFYLGDLEASRAAFERHARMQPEEADTQFGLGLVDLEEGRLDDAESRFRAAIELNAGVAQRASDQAKAWARLGDVFQDRGDLDEARAAWERCLGLNPDHYEAHYKLFRLFNRLGDTAAAEAAQTAYLAARERVRPSSR